MSRMATVNAQCMAERPDPPKSQSKISGTFFCEEECAECSKPQDARLAPLFRAFARKATEEHNRRAIRSTWRIISRPGLADQRAVTRRADDPTRARGEAYDPQGRAPSVSASGRIIGAVIRIVSNTHHINDAHGMFRHEDINPKSCPGLSCIE